jgi:hypothetical protein
MNTYNAMPTHTAFHKNVDVAVLFSSLLRIVLLLDDATAAPATVFDSAEEDIGLLDCSFDRLFYRCLFFASSFFSSPPMSTHFSVRIYSR